MGTAVVQMAGDCRQNRADRHSGEIEDSGYNGRSAGMDKKEEAVVMQMIDNNRQNGVDEHSGQGGGGRDIGKSKFQRGSGTE